MKYFGKSIEKGIDWLSLEFEGFFDAITTGVDFLVNSLQEALLNPSPIIVFIFLSLLVYHACSKEYGFFSKAGFKKAIGNALIAFFVLLITHSLLFWALGIFPEEITFSSLFSTMFFQAHSLPIIYLLAGLGYYFSAVKHGLFTRAGWKEGRFLGIFTFFGLVVLERNIIHNIVEAVVFDFAYWNILALLLVVLIPALLYYNKAKAYGLFTKAGYNAAGGYRVIIQFVVLLFLYLFASKEYMGLIVFASSYWEQTMLTLALVVGSALIALLIGIPVGIWASRNAKVEATLRPILDLMQTLPPFVYLIPAILFFSVGNVPGVVATVVFALPPGVRLTSLGIRSVQPDAVEAAHSFGASDRQLLFKVQLPLAKPTILAGVNQVIMLSLSMVVIASMVGAKGLGNAVYKGILRADLGLGFEAGLGIVIIAILLDRITQKIGT